MKFISWNVNGLNSCIKSGDFSSYLNNENADFICLQETKSQININKILQYDYKQYWNNSIIKNGYSGTVIFCKEEPLDVVYGLKDEYDEEFDFEGRVITLEYDSFYIVNCYVPNTKISIKRKNYRIEFDEYFYNYIEKLNNIKDIIICGDFNVAYKNLDICYKYRKSNLIKFNDEIRGSFRNLLNLNLIDTYRYFHPQMVKYSWFFNNNTHIKNQEGWRLDYFLISSDLKKKIRKADINNNIYGSDHSPIELELSI